METTNISPERTASEIQLLLREAGASQILTEYSKDKKISGLFFKLEIYGQEVPFSLPARIDPVFLYLQNKRAPLRRHDKRDIDLEQAERVAWRQLLRWIQAQLAMIETGMVAAGEVFMPYIQTKSGKTLYESATVGGKLALPLPKGE